uniref:BolA-like protein 1 n=1 Tax=Salmo trutta TaxID=8032 RepID=A0A674CWF2_SALTR
MLPSVLSYAPHFRPHMAPDPNLLMEGAIRTKLTQQLEPEHLEVHNESHMHAVPPGSESHFRVLVVSPRFDCLSLLQRHRLLNETLAEELKTCIHVLAIQAKTPQQWGSNPSIARAHPAWEDPRGTTRLDSRMAQDLVVQ